MRSTTIFRVAILGANAIFALSTDQPKNGLTIRSRRSVPGPRLEMLAGNGPEGVSADPVYYNKNWAGAVHTSAGYQSMEGGGYKSVTGAITIPPIRLPPGGDPDVLYAVSAWVGIDGELACPRAILQAGVDMYMNKGVAQYWAWYEWYPSLTTYLPGTFEIASDDVITLSVTAPTPTSALVSIINNTTGQAWTATLADQAPALCGANAEWIVEDFWDSDGAPLVDFGRIRFDQAAYTTASGGTGGVEDAKMDGVKYGLNGPVVIGCEKTGEGDGVECVYGGWEGLGDP
ncbi:hypothetical protein VTK26DRAFT_6780 [Humicola hyalothermophila]